jgi:dTDP-4-dehydrorhamnose 3,5-epimerase-like enzyme
VVQCIDFPKISDPRGSLTFLQSFDQVPFEIKRVYWLFDIPGGARRGAHAYKSQEEIVIALSGSFDVTLVDALGKESIVSMNRANEGLYIPKLTWRNFENFSTNACALVLNSSLYDKNDYIYDFLELMGLSNEK